jgi:hypothetical protein
LIAFDGAKALRWLGLKRPIHLKVIASPGSKTVESQRLLLAQVIHTGDGITSR